MLRKKTPLLDSMGPFSHLNAMGSPTLTAPVPDTLTNAPRRARNRPHPDSRRIPLAGARPAPILDVTLETTETITPAMMRRQSKNRLISAQQQQHLRELIGTRPEPGESVHIVNNGKSDFWTWVPVMLGWLETADEFFCSTWTLNRQAALDILRFFDEGRLRAVSVLTGVYFKRRESSVHATLVEGLLARRQRFIALESHAKVLLLANRDKETYLVVEGSANLTSNPRIEQYMITDDFSLYEFHKRWMEEALATR